MLKASGWGSWLLKKTEEKCGMGFTELAVMPATQLETLREKFLQVGTIGDVGDGKYTLPSYLKLKLVTLDWVKPPTLKNAAGPLTVHLI
jgi:hypothetical protein